MEIFLERTIQELFANHRLRNAVLDNIITFQFDNSGLFHFNIELITHNGLDCTQICYVVYVRKTETTQRYLNVMSQTMF